MVQSLSTVLLTYPNTAILDPKYEEEVSGCTASVGLISKTTIYVVGSLLCSSCNIDLMPSRPMQEILGLYWESRVEQSLSHMIISHKTRVGFSR